MTTWNKIFFILSVFFLGVLLYFLAPVLTPFLVGALLAYLGDPLVQSLVRLRIPRLLSVIIVFTGLFLFIILLILLFIPLIQKQILLLIDVFPKIIEWIQTTLVSWLQDRLGIELISVNQLKTTLAANLSKAGGAAAWVGLTVLHSGVAILTWLTSLILIPVVTFYLLRDWNKVVKGIRGLLPRRIEPTVSSLIKECDSVLSAFFRGQLLVMLSLGIIYSIGLTVIGLKVGLMIGLIAGLVSIVPYLGFIIGIVTASVVAMVQFGTWTSLISVWVVFLIGQALEGSLLTPNLVGNRIGLHPVAVIFAVLAGGSLFGFFGILLALPVAAVIMVLLRFIYRHYRTSPLYR